MPCLLGKLGAKRSKQGQKLIDMGFRVSVTGGLDVNTSNSLKVDVFTFIAGRGITEAADPEAQHVPLRTKSNEFGG